MSPAEVRVAEVMSAVVVTVTPDDSLSAAWELLRRGAFHHLPVVGRDRRCVSLVDDRLVAGSLVSSNSWPRRRVADVMPPRVHCVVADASLRKAAQIMCQERSTAVPVVDDDMRLIGIVTAFDVVAFVAEMSSAVPAEAAAC